MVLLWGQVAISLSISVWNGSVPAKISWWLRWVKIKLMRLSMEFIARQSNSSSSQPQIFSRRVFHAKHPSITDYGVCSDRSDGACKYYLCVFLTLASSRLDGANQTWRRAKHRNSTANEWHNTSHDAVTYSYANNLTGARYLPAQRPALLGNGLEWPDLGRQCQQFTSFYRCWPDRHDC